MPRKPKPEKPGDEVLALIPSEILDQIVRDGPLTAEEIETASRRLPFGRSDLRTPRASKHRASLHLVLPGQFRHHVHIPRLDPGGRLSE